MFDLKNKRILITGAGGFLGYWVTQEIKKASVKEIITPRSRDIDLRKETNCRKVVQNCDAVIHLAANVGGIELNRLHPGKLFFDNVMMGVNLIEEARKAKVKKMLIIGTACSYPKYCHVPFNEEEFWSGYPEEVTGVYGMAKKMLLVQAQAYRKEYNFNTIYLILTNLYGPGDHFDSNYSHVIPSLISRMLKAKKNKETTFTVWGTGSATREFIYGEDAARAIVSALKNYDDEKPVNVGTGKEISIRELVEMLKRIIRYEGKIVWDTDKPDGQPRRALDTTHAKDTFGFEAKVSLHEGLKKTVDWYIEHQTDSV